MGAGIVRARARGSDEVDRGLSSRRAATAIAVGLAAAGCGTSKETPVNGPIAAAYKDGIYLVQPSGAGQRRLPGSAYGSWLDWSRDGRWLVFDRADARGRRVFDVYVVRRDGTRLRRVLENAGYPSWAPDGKRLVVTRDSCPNDCESEENTLELYVIDVSGHVQRRLTTNSGYDGEGSWSPDGDRIAYAGDDGIYVMDADGSNKRRLMPGPWTQPVWSPDGRKIAYDDGYFEIFVVDAADGRATRLTHRRQPERAPTWSPDGKRIAFLSTDARCKYCGGEWPMQIWVMNADGSQQHRITREAGYGPPAWAPSG